MYLLLDVMTIVGLIETTVRPIEDTPWIPVVREEEEHMDTSTDDIIPSAYKEKLLPLRVDLPPSLLLFTVVYLIVFLHVIGDKNVVCCHIDLSLKSASRYLG